MKSNAFSIHSFSLILIASLVTVLSFASFGQIKNHKLNADDFSRAVQIRLSDQALVIENVSVIDAVNPIVQPNKTVVINGNRIKAIGEKGKTLLG